MIFPAARPDVDDENRMLLALVHASSSLSLEELAGRLEIGRGRLIRALQRLYERRYILVSRGIGPISDTYVLTEAARAHIRSHIPGAAVPRSAAGSPTGWRPRLRCPR